jgi:hypothetical protein
MTVRQWSKILSSEDDARIRDALERHLGITEDDAERLRK